MIQLTLNQLRAAEPCKEGWRAALKCRRKRKADDAPFALAELIQSNGIQETLWAIKAVQDQERELRHLARVAAERIAPCCSREISALIRSKNSIEIIYQTGMNCCSCAADWAAVTAFHPDVRWAARSASLFAVNLNPDNLEIIKRAL
jgi:hypothetical protein